MEAKLENEVVESIQKIVELSVEYLSKNRDRQVKVVDFKTPEELESLIDFKIPEKGTGLQGILAEIEKTMKYSVRTGHVRFYNQLWAGNDIPAILAEWLTAVMNSSMYTYEVSPVFSIMEVRLIQKVKELLGWGQSGDGVFAPGGAHCNLLAILAARNESVENIRYEGIGNRSLVCFSSVHDHYTVQRAAGVLGVGENNCIKIDVDEEGLMLPDKLEAAIIAAKEAGKIPFFINATSGTTVLGAYDPLEAICAIGKKHSVWVHVDACWGGHCLLTPKYRHLMKGCEQADSVSWTATKCLGLPQQCAAIFVRRPNSVLARCNAMGKDYLFHEHEEKQWDLGEKTLNCGRRVDAFKLWVAWKVAGEQGFAERVEHAFAQAQHLTKKLMEQPTKYRMVREHPQSLNVCFWYIPPSARNLPDGPERDQKIDEATVTIRRRMQKEGKLLLNYSDLAGCNAHFFRMITCNPGATPEDMEFIVSEIDRLGSDL